MARIGKHKQKYDKYKNSGNKAKNKILKQERHEKRLAKFAKKREDGKGYVYSKEKSDNKFNKYCTEYNLNIQNSTELRNSYFKPNQNSNRGKHTPLAKYTSEMRKLDNRMKEREEAEKKNKANAKAKENSNR